MSPQPGLVARFPLEKAGETALLIFGDASRLHLTIAKALLSKMWGQVDEGVRLLPRGGAEVGGLLVGPKARKGTVVVDAIIPVPIEYQHGPSFRMSPSDIAKIEGLVETVQSDPSKAVVGFYRSQTRGNETFRDTDREIFDAIEKVHSSFAADFLCYFVLAPISRAEKLACISMWNGTDWEGLQFTLRSSLLSAAPMPMGAAALPAATATQVAMAQATGQVARASLPVAVPAAAAHPLAAAITPPVTHAVRTPEYQPASSGPPKRLYVLLAAIAGAVLLLMAAIGGYRSIFKSRSQTATSGPAQATTPTLRMGFSADREGPVWKLSWDRGTMEVLNPTAALLEIKDGANEQQLHLTPADLFSGTIFYTPQSGNLVFSLEVERRGAAPIEEHIRVLEGPRKETADTGRPAPPNTISNTIPNKVIPNGVASSSGANAGAKANGAPPTQAPPTTISNNPEPTSARPGPSRVFQVSPKAPAPAPAPVILGGAPPALGETTAVPAVAFAVPIAPRLAAPAAQTAPPPQAARPNAPGVANQAPPVAPAAATTTASLNYIPPKPVQQVRPEPPPRVSTTGVQIQVRVEIDVHGKVTKATPIGVSAANSAFMLQAVRAAQTWVFQPAQFNGKPVASEMNLVFQF